MAFFQFGLKKKKKWTEPLDLRLTDLSKPQFLYLGKNNHITYLTWLLEESKEKIHVKFLGQYSRLKIPAMMMIMKRVMMACGEIRNWRYKDVVPSLKRAHSLLCRQT